MMVLDSRQHPDTLCFWLVLPAAKMLVPCRKKFRTRLGCSGNHCFQHFPTKCWHFGVVDAVCELVCRIPCLLLAKQGTNGLSIFISEWYHGCTLMFSYPWNPWGKSLISGMAREGTTPSTLMCYEFGIGDQRFQSWRKVGLCRSGIA